MGYRSGYGNVRLELVLGKVGGPRRDETAILTLNIKDQCSRLWYKYVYYNAR
jgi:hypothetical protein